MIATDFSSEPLDTSPAPFFSVVGSSERLKSTAEFTLAGL